MILETLRCDRCRETCHEPDRTTWARIYAATLSGSYIVGTSETPADLCAFCAMSLKAWYGLSSEDTSARVKIEIGDKVAVGNVPAVVESAPRPGRLFGNEPLCPDGDPDWLKP